MMTAAQENEIGRQSQLDEVTEVGISILKNFFTEDEISKIEIEIYKLIQGMSRSLGVDEKFLPTFMPKNIDKCIVDFLKKYPRQQGPLYDRLQRIPELLAVPAMAKVQNVAKAILSTEEIGVWPRVQMRLDLPYDEENVIHWHTDYMYNKGTKHSYTFWFPIVDVSEEMGPLLFALKSHKLQLEAQPIAEKSKFKFNLPDHELKKLSITKPQTNRRDLIVFHSELWHSGQVNQSIHRARLSGLFRLQNLNKLELEK